ncbi:MAG: hypothetical protein ACLR6B_08595 [Blautia sp.]
MTGVIRYQSSEVLGTIEKNNHLREFSVGSQRIREFFSRENWWRQPTTGCDHRPRCPSFSRRRQRQGLLHSD